MMRAVVVVALAFLVRFEKRTDCGESESGNYSRRGGSVLCDDVDIP